MKKKINSDPFYMYKFFFFFFFFESQNYAISIGFKNFLAFSGEIPIAGRNV
jgi:hypothetical protein